MGLSDADMMGFLGGPTASASPESPSYEVARLYNETFSIAKRVVRHGNYHFICGGGTDSGMPLPSLRNRASAKLNIYYQLLNISLRKGAAGIGEIGSILGDIESTNEAAALAFQASQYEAAEASLCAPRKKASPDVAKDSSAEKAAGPRLRADEAFLEKEWRRMFKEGTLDDGAGWWPGEGSMPSGECLTLQREYAADVQGGDLVSARAVLDRAAKASCGWRARAESNFIGNAFREREAGAQRKERCRKAFDGYKRAASERADLEVILKFLEPAAECEWGIWVAATKAEIQKFLASRAKTPPAAGSGPKNEKGFWDYFWGGVADGVNAGGKVILDAMNQDFQRRLIQQRNARPGGTKGTSAAAQLKPPAESRGGYSRPVESNPGSECRRMDEMIYQAARSNNLDSVNGLWRRWEVLGCTFSARTDAAVDAAIAASVQRSTQPLRDTLERMKSMKP